MITVPAGTGHQRIFLGPHFLECLHDLSSGFNVRASVEVVLLLPKGFLNFGLLSLDLFDIKDVTHLIVNVFELKFESKLHSLLVAE